MARKKPKPKSTPKKQPLKISFKLSKQQKIVLGSFLFLLGLALLFSFISYFFNWQADQSTLTSIADREVEAQNWLNKFGAALGDFFIYQGFGVAAFTLAVLVALTGFYYFFDNFYLYLHSIKGFLVGKRFFQSFQICLSVISNS